MNLRSDMEKLKNRKKELGWTNEKLSQESGIPVGTLNKIFNGTTRYPREKTLSALIRAMGLDYYMIEDFGAGASLIRETGAYQPMKRNGLATLGTYYSLPEGIRAELIDGKLYYRPAPRLGHQALLMSLLVPLGAYFEKKKGDFRVFAGPCDVRLDGDDYTMVQPALFVVNGKEMLVNGEYCMGAPEFVLEIASPEDPEHEYELKRYKYQNAGVKEYWIADPAKLRVVAYVFARDAVPVVCTFEDRVRPYLYPDLEIDFAKIRERML